MQIKKQTNQQEDQTKGKEDNIIKLRLYICGQTPNSIKAFTNLKKICEGCLNGKYVLEVVDLSEDPKRANLDEILVLPTLVRQGPPPRKKVVGNLSNWDHVLRSLELSSEASVD